MERSRFYRDLSIDLRSERDKSVYFGHGVVIYFIMQSLVEKTAKTHLSARKAAVRHLVYFVNSLGN